MTQDALGPGEAFAAALGLAAPPAPASLLGLEHEYQVWRDRAPVDFRELIHTLPVPGLRLDPGDRNAYRLPSGLVLTADGAEAEIACPPIAVTSGFTRKVSAWSTMGQAQVEALLPAGYTLSGYSTHISLSMPEELCEEACQLFASRFAAALMLLADTPEGFGLYVRPRPGRLELCLDYLDGSRLRVACAFAAGAVACCAAALEKGDQLPPALDVSLEDARGRAGVYVGRRRAFGLDLYSLGRQTSLPLLEGGEVRAQNYLEIAWLLARKALAGRADASDLALVDATVAGRHPLGVEDSIQEAETPLPPPAPSPYGNLLTPRQRPSLEVRPEMATWGFTVFRIDGSRSAHACVPSALLPSFLERLDAGELDAAVRRYLDSTPADRVLSDNVETRGAGLWDEVGAPLALLPAEPGPASGLYAADADRATKPVDEARYGKPLLLPLDRAEAAPAPAAPSRVPTPMPPTLPRHVEPPVAPPPLPPEPEPVPSPAPPWRTPVVAALGALAAIVLVGAVIAGPGGDLLGGSSPVVEPARTATPSATPTATRVVETPLPNTPTPEPTATPPRPTETRPAGISTTAPPATATRPPATPTRVLDNTPTRVPTCSVGGALGLQCTPTPGAVRTATPLVDPTRTPTRLPTCVPGGAAGLACTPTPTRTPLAGGGAAN